MVDTYTAWDGNSYPWPPPEGWVMGTDGRYWPEGRQPGAAAAAPGPPPGVRPPPPPGAPQPSAMPPPSAVPPPGAPPPGAYSPPPPGKSSNAGLWVLGIFGGIILLTLAGCVAVVSTLNRAGDVISEGYSELADSTQRRTEAEQATAISECAVRGGIPVASGTVTNQRDIPSDYMIVIDFYDTSDQTFIGSNQEKGDHPRRRGPQGLGDRGTSQRLRGQCPLRPGVRHDPVGGLSASRGSRAAIHIWWAGPRSRGRARPERRRVGGSAPPAGLEPATVGLEVRCSIRLSYGGRHSPGFGGDDRPILVRPIGGSGRSNRRVRQLDRGSWQDQIGSPGPGGRSSVG